MGGKAIMLVILGFSMIFAVVNFNSSNTTTRAIDNLSEYYSKTNLHNIAASGANMAANKVFKDPTYTGTYTDLAYNGGTVDITVTDFGVDKKLIKSTATFHGIFDGEIKEDTALVKIVLQPSSFSKFGYYTNLWPGWGYLVTGDTIDGPFHTNGKLNTLGSPVFIGKATTKDGVNSIGNVWGFGAADPQFLGGYESPVDVPFNLDPSKLETAASFGGRVFQDGTGTDPQDVRLIFNDDETVTWSMRKTGTTTWSTPIVADLDTLAPNGVLWNKSGNLYVSGTVNGKYTVGTAKHGSQHGYVYLEDDIVYREDPLEFSGGTTTTNPACEDMLGIVAAKQVVVSDNPANHNDINIHASLFNHDGGITVENINWSSPDMGIMRIHGGLIENEARVTGYTSGAGYNQVIKYDRRFQTTTPPFFPATEQLEVVSWFE